MDKKAKEHEDEFNEINSDLLCLFGISATSLLYLTFALAALFVVYLVPGWEPKDNMILRIFFSFISILAFLQFIRTAQTKEIVHAFHRYPLGFVIMIVAFIIAIAIFLGVGWILDQVF
ncbi:MAG: hypothetical protein ACHP6H_02255 [Legionellales bacterium]